MNTKRSLCNVSGTLIALSAMFLAGCGGGSSTSNPPASFSSATTTGVAAKGIIKNAIVTAYELNSLGVSVRTVGTSVTDTSGKYSLTIGSSYTGGPIKLVLSANNDGSSKMVCDVSAGCGGGILFGQDYTLPAGFTLVAMQQALANGDTVTTQITPYTNMANARVQAQIQAGTTLDSNLVATANSEVSQIVGVNITTTEPVDITNASAVAAASAEALQYGAFNAGIGNVAFANAGGFASGVAAAATSFSDGQFDNADAVSIASITAAVGVEATNHGLGTPTLTATLTNIASNTAGGTYNPQPAPAATQTAVAQARGLVSQTRTWGTQISSLQTPADAFSLDVSTASAVLNSDSSALGGALGEVLGGAMQEVSTQATSAAGLLAQTYTYPISYWTAIGQKTGSGSVTVVSSGGFLTLNISSTITGITSSGTVTTTIPSNILGVSSPSLDIASFTMNVTGTASKSAPAASITYDKAAFSMAFKSGKTSATAVVADIASIGLDGGVTLQANGVSFAGTGKFNLVANNVVNAKMPLSLSEVALSGTFTSSKGSVNAAASVKFNNAATFDVFGLLTHQPMVWVNQWQPGDAFGAAAAYANVTGGDTLQWGSYDSYWGNTCGYGLLAPYQCLPGDAFGLVPAVTSAISASYTNPSPISVQDVYVNYSSMFGTNYGAMLLFPDFESANNFANATITISSQVALAGNPAATLTITANRTGIQLGDGICIIAYNGQSIKAEVSNATNPATRTLTVTNPDGVKLVYNGDNSAGEVSVNNTVVGTIDVSGGMPMIHYNDGTFESLNF